MLFHAFKTLPVPEGVESSCSRNGHRDRKSGAWIERDHVGSKIQNLGNGVPRGDGYGLRHAC